MTSIFSCKNRKKFWGGRDVVGTIWMILPQYAIPGGGWFQITTRPGMHVREVTESTICLSLNHIILHTDYFLPSKIVFIFNRYKQMAKMHKEEERKNLANKFDAQGRSLLSLEEERQTEKRKIEKMVKEISEIIDAETVSKTLPDRKFFFLHINTLVEVAKHYKNSIW